MKIPASGLSLLGRWLPVANVVAKLAELLVSELGIGRHDRALAILWRIFNEREIEVEVWVLVLFAREVWPALGGQTVDGVAAVAALYVKDALARECPR